jgi:hypothetical protein
MKTKVVKNENGGIIKNFINEHQALFWHLLGDKDETDGNDCFWRKRFS